MARLAGNDLPLSGQIGKQLVFKNYDGKTVVTRHPDMRGINPSERQKERRNIFKEAVEYAKSVCRDPGLKEIYAIKVAKGQSVYHFAIKEYMQAAKSEQGTEDSGQ